MKKIQSILFVLGTLFLASCEKDSEGVSKTTTYCTFEMSGDQRMYVELGTTFTDPGCIAFEGETEVPTTEVSNVNANLGGIYSITYSAVNSDGFPASVTRDVIVYYPDAEIMGIYTSTIVRNGTQNRGPYSIEVIPFSVNTFHVADLLGGWYWFGSRFGPTYAFPTVLQFDSSNVLSVVSADPSAWGSVGQLVTSGVTPTIDTTTGTIHYVARMSDTNAFLFNVTLNKQ